MRLVANEEVPGKLTAGKIYNGNLVSIPTGKFQDNGAPIFGTIMKVYSDAGTWESMAEERFVPFDMIVQQQAVDQMQGRGPALVLANQLPPEELKTKGSASDFLKGKKK